MKYYNPSIQSPNCLSSVRSLGFLKPIQASQATGGTLDLDRWQSITGLTHTLTPTDNLVYNSLMSVLWRKLEHSEETHGNREHANSEQKDLLAQTGFDLCCASHWANIPPFLNNCIQLFVLYFFPSFSSN